MVVLNACEKFPTSRVAFATFDVIALALTLRDTFAFLAQISNKFFAEVFITRPFVEYSISCAMAGISVPEASGFFVVSNTRFRFESFDQTIVEHDFLLVG